MRSGRAGRAWFVQRMFTNVSDSLDTTWAKGQREEASKSGGPTEIQGTWEELETAEGGGRSPEILRRGFLLTQCYQRGSVAI